MRPGRHPGEVLRTFARLGVTSFGGPVAHLGYFRDELVTRRRWVTEERYGELVALCQVLPGPTSSQVGFALGLVRGGPLGAAAAWLAFTLPSALLLVLLAAGAVSLDGAVAHGVMVGLKSVAVAVVAHAVWGMARTLTPDVRRILIACGAAALALTLTGNVGQLAAIGLGVAAGVVVCRDLPGRAEAHALQVVTRRVGLASFGLFVTLLVGLPVLARLAPSVWTAVADAFYRAGALVLGGGHVVLPLLQAEPAVANAVPTGDVLAGYAAAQAVPGPLFTFAAFLGYDMGPGAAAPWTALVALVAVFLPGILLLLAALPYWESLRRRTGVRAAVAGASAAVVGILAAALWDPILTSTVTGVVPGVIAAVCLALLTVAKAPPWAVVLAGAVAGALFAR